MKIRIIQSSLCLVFFVLSSSIMAEKPDTTFLKRTGEPVEGIRIAWDYSSMQKLAPQGEHSGKRAGYPRVRKLKDGR